MKKITVIIPPNKFDNLKKKLIEDGVKGITITRVDGFGYEKKQMDVLKNKEILIESLPKIKLEIVLKDNEVDDVINSIIAVTRTGRLGDGKIFVSEITDVIRIRTGERKEDAL
ncbi:MAG: P-II family nitrogen regulator [Candidatus Goldbacteria bacterium]|nr:P-II family nitrogen regulator [Candidatus Goldiibacteriota bacterium]HPD18280.1 P-II family nitrogen regulator [Candidatus Goldiibacteriota bacterium]